MVKIGDPSRGRGVIVGWDHGPYPRRGVVRFRRGRVFLGRHLFAVIAWA